MRELKQSSQPAWLNASAIDIGFIDDLVTAQISEVMQSTKLPEISETARIDVRGRACSGSTLQALPALRTAAHLPSELSQQGFISLMIYVVYYIHMYVLT